MIKIYIGIILLEIIYISPKPCFFVKRAYESIGEQCFKLPLNKKNTHSACMKDLHTTKLLFKCHLKNLIDCNVNYDKRECINLQRSDLPFQ